VPNFQKGNDKGTIAVQYESIRKAAMQNLSKPRKLSNISGGFLSWWYGKFSKGRNSGQSGFGVGEFWLLARESMAQVGDLNSPPVYVTDWLPISGFRRR
jgi:hypothetical protein